MSAPSVPSKVFRCAVYTRKSSEEGLEQAFNSLHAQRAACEAYILSQAGEGWSCLPALYDDGGISGATMVRPGLQRLLADIAAKLIDVVVVYKVDRLSRSLGDFARIVEVFDAAEVSFVSVTQAFNTTSSMGRLTLNVLLSFAQFEREVTGERIRDKVALSKAKGMWMGGILPLGYDQRDQRLVIHPAEALQVRALYARYLELGSAHRMCMVLEAEGVRSKLWTTRAGKRVGGAVITRGALYHLLSNRTYLGEIVHKETRYPASHAAIVSPELFEAVQARLALNRVSRRTRRAVPAQAWLTGRLYDGEGRRFSPTFSTGRGGRIHRYYVRTDVQLGRAAGEERAGTLRRVAADALEQLVLQALRRLADRPTAGASDLLPMLQRLELRPTTTEIVLDAQLLFGSDHRAFALDELNARLAGDERCAEEPMGRVRIALPRRMQLRGGRTWTLAPPAPACRTDPVLVEALRRAHSLAQASGDESAARSVYERRLVRLAYLAPDLQRDIVQGRQPASLTLAALMRAELPLSWARQRVLARRLNAEAS